jgi:ribosomal protein L11 methyltransferase
MHWIEAKVIFESDDPIIAGDLICNIFYELGIQGVCTEEPDALPDEPADKSFRADRDYAVSGYFSVDNQMESRRSMLEENLTKLERENNIVSRIVYRKIQEEDWSESWKKYFSPTKITDRIVIKPTWHEYIPKKGETIIEVDPGMAFGTGTHPTTSLCVAMIEKYIGPEDTFLDIGSGSGILMIAASKLGAKKVWGIDNDEAAVAIATANLRLNNIEDADFNVTKGDLVSGITRRFTIITANILSEVIIVLLDSIKDVMGKGGVLICSGIIEKNAGIVLDKMSRIGLETVEIQSKDEWVTIVAKENHR